MKKAYIITAYKLPDLLIRLISRLNDEHSTFFVHIDRNVPIAQFSGLEAFGNKVILVERASSRWGTFGQVQAVINALKAIKTSNIQFDVISLLSGQDYPIKSNQYIDDFFSKASQFIYMDFFPIPNRHKWGTEGGMFRVNKYFLGLSARELLFTKSLNLLAGYFPFLQRRIYADMQPYSGSTWWSIDMYTFNYIINFIDNHPKYSAFHKYTFGSDELYFQMLLLNSKDENIKRRIINNNKRYIKWKTPIIANPELLTENDLHDLLTSDALFARKFDLSPDTSLLDTLDAHCI